MSTGAGEAALRAAFAATWPAAEVSRTGGLETGRGLGAGGRVSSTQVAAADWSEADIDAAVAQHRAWGQPPLALVWDGDGRLARALAARGWREAGPTVLLTVPVAALTGRPLPAMTAIEAGWPPLAVQRELWAAGGVGRERQAVMARVRGRRTTLLGRGQDRPGATAFVAQHGPVAFLHALEVSPGLRRHGLGAALLRKAAGWAAEGGAETLALAVGAGNAGALALYDGLGFGEAGRYAYWEEREPG